MKQLWIALFFVSYLNAAAQKKTEKYVPVIGSGTVLHYSFGSTNSMFIPITVQLPEGGGMVMELALSEDFPGGPAPMTIRMSQASLDNATRSEWRQPIAHETRVLPDDKMVGFSTTFVRTLKEKKSAIFDGITYRLTEMTSDGEFMLGEQLLDALYMVSEDGRTAYWLLNHPQYPIMLRSWGNRFGPDILLMAITGKPGK
ncbi:MAG: hypothetical protein MUD08_04735 [Cytophagales bacterium]|jgi:hypothetical protein|nr:hypothetical protein [Cytophagales bacterium]